MPSLFTILLLNLGKCCTQRCPRSQSSQNHFHTPHRRNTYIFCHQWSRWPLAKSLRATPNWHSHPHTFSSLENISVHSTMTIACASTTDKKILPLNSLKTHALLPPPLQYCTPTGCIWASCRPQISTVPETQGTRYLNSLSKLCTQICDKWGWKTGLFNPTKPLSKQSW